ncbi:MAG TPA: outer membrane beta-barrel domain-containing protein [Kofleriaceae bacterium]|jgi:outer membrane beta-barrel protein|nr:outer membrane beta-barrel domain-containing protein [Kofleriaceae bacterium]
MNKQTFLGTALVLAAAVAPIVVDVGEALADRRHNSLGSDVAVRHRRLLVKNRFEFAPLFESTINADFRHIVGGGAKLEYHLGDMLSFGVVGVGATALDTGLVKKIEPTLEMVSDPNTREPSKDEFMTRLNKMPVHGAAYVSLTPWYGKLAAFGQAFVAFDFYFQAGVSFASLKSDCPTTVCSDTHPGVPDAMGNPPDQNPNNDPALNSGGRLGLYLGGGIHVFLNDFLALDLTVRDYAFTDNPSGADFNADLAVTNEDNRFMHHLFFGAGVSIMFPMTVKRTP